MHHFLEIGTTKGSQHAKFILTKFQSDTSNDLTGYGMDKVSEKSHVC